MIWSHLAMASAAAGAIFVHMRRIRVSHPDAQHLIDAVTAPGDGMPVRALETVLNHGEAGVGMLVVGLRSCLESRRPALAQWCAVGLGECGDADAAPELAPLLRYAWRGRDIGVGFAAAEALGRMGAPAEEALLQNASLTTRSERYWFLYAAARMATPRACEFLLSEVKSNLQLADVAALALADVGDAEALPEIGRMLARVSQWQLVFMAQAVLAMHRRTPVLGEYTLDWRLRYRHSPGFGLFPPLWPCLTALLRAHRRGRAAAGASAPPRSIAAILTGAEPRPADPPPCGVCNTGVPRPRTGVVVCDTCAPAVARVQAECLLQVECSSNDLFDVLNVIDGQLMRLEAAGSTSGDAWQRHLLARDACHWLVQQRIESVAEGAATLLAESCSCSGTCTCAPVAGPDP